MALLLAWSFLPGGFELIEQTVHLVSKGHLAHSIPDDPDELPADAEHGCQGLMHVCHCHHGAGQVGPQPPASLAPLPVRLPSMVSVSKRHDDPPVRGVFHPPERGFRTL